MVETKLIFIQELTKWDQLPPAVSEPLRNELAGQGFFNGTSFCFVGVFYSASADAVVVGYPKYCPPPDTPDEKRALLEQIDLICQVAAQARRAMPSNPEFDDCFQPLASRNPVQEADPYELAVFLMRDYAENGLYTERTVRVRTDGVGRRDWRRTMQHTTPVLGREPLYLNPVTVQSKRGFSDPVTPLHAHVILNCARLLQPLRLFEQVALPELVHPLGENTDPAQYIPVLNEKLTRTFSERELRLLRALRTWCGQTPYNRGRFGVTAFELLWEYAANQYFGNISHTRSGAPRYYRVTEAGGHRRFAGSGDAVPDILYAAGSAGGDTCLAIFDAKYYCPVWNEASGGVSGAPANADVAKQIQYYHSLRQRYPGEGIRFSNAFLLPRALEDGIYQYAGYVTENDTQNREISEKLAISCAPHGFRDRVLLYFVDPVRLWRACLRGEHVAREEVFHEFAGRFESGGRQ